MKVAYINSVAGIGSTGQLIYQLSRINGLHGKIYYGRKSNATDADSMKMNDSWGYARHAIGTFLFDNHCFCNEKETLVMIEDLKKFKPDLIHIHDLHGYYIHIEPLFAYLKESKIPVIWTFHDCWPFTGHCAHYDAVKCERWKTQCQQCPALMTYPCTLNSFHVKRNFERKKELFTSLGKQLTIVTPSKWLEKQVHMSFLKEANIRTIHSGIDLDKFKRVDSTFREKHNIENKFVILAIANCWNKEKGLNDLKKLSFSLLEDEVLVVVGLNKFQKKGFNENHTLLLSRMSKFDELLEIYSTADIMINLTYQNTFPTVNIEALACGCPVLTYNTGGSVESLGKYTGVVVETGNVDYVVQALNQIKKKKIKLSTRACIKQSKYFKQDNMVYAYRALYQEKTGIFL